MSQWNPNQSGTVGLEFFPTSIVDRTPSGSKAVAMTVDSTATEVIDQAHIGFGGIAQAGTFMLDVFESGDEVPGSVTTESFVPNADLTNTSGTWDNQAGSSTNVYQSIDNGTVNPASYATYAGTVAQAGVFEVEFGTAAWAANRRVVGIRFVFAANVEGEFGFGRLNGTYYNGSTRVTLGSATLSNTVEYFTFSLGELNPATGTPWTQAHIVALDSTAGFGWQAVSGTAAGMRIYDARIEIDYVTEDRVAVGVETFTAFPSSGTGSFVTSKTFDLFAPNTGSANWSKAASTTYTFVLRPVSATSVLGVVTAAGSGQVRTLDSGAALPTGSVGYLPTLDGSGIVSALGTARTFGMALALDVNASATDSVDGMPYGLYASQGALNSGQSQTINGAASADYSLLRVAVGFQRFNGTTTATAPTGDLTVDIIEPGPTTLATVTISPDEFLDAPLLFTQTSVGGSTFDFRLVEKSITPVTLAAATTYTVTLTAGVSSNWTGAPLSTDFTDGDFGEPATYGGTTLSYDTNTSLDLPVTLSTVPDPVEGFTLTVTESALVNAGQCAITSNPYMQLTWTPTALGADFGYYQIQRKLATETVWSTIAQITDEFAVEFRDSDARIGVEACYRIRVVRDGDLIPSAWSDTYSTRNITVGDAPLALTTGPNGDLWVVNSADDTVSQISPTNMVVADTYAVGDLPSAILSADGSIWVANATDDTVTRMDPDDGTILATINVGQDPAGLAWTGEYVLVTSPTDNEFDVILAATNTVVGTIPVSGTPTCIVWADGFAWIGCSGDSTLRRVDISGNVTSIVGQAVSGTAIAYSDGFVWAADGIRLQKLDTSTSSFVSTVLVATTANVTGVAIDSAGFVWATDDVNDTATRINPTTLAIDAVVATGGGPAGIAANGTAMWVANEDDDTVTRIDPTCGTITTADCGLWFSSNLFPDLAVAYSRSDEITWQFPSSDETAIVAPAGVDYQTALIADEWRGDVFAPLLNVFTSNRQFGGTEPAQGLGRWAFDPLIDLSRAAAPYICVRDETGRRWFANVNVDSATRLEPAHRHATSPVVTEVTATPAVVDLAGPAVLDDFNRANNVSSLGDTVTGQTWTQIPFNGGGVLGIDAGEAYCSTTDTLGLLAWVDSGVADGYCQATITPGASPTGQAGLLFRADFGSINGYNLSFLSNSNAIVLFRLTGGSPTVLGSAPYPTAASVTLRAEYSGSTITVYQDDVQILQVTDSTYASETEVGFSLNTLTGRVEDFSSGTLPAYDPTLYTS